MSLLALSRDALEDPWPAGGARTLARRVWGSPIARQFGGLTGARSAAAALSFLWLAIAARQLPLAAFADLALLLSLGAITSVMADFGFSLVLNDAVAADPARGQSTLRVVLRCRLILAALAVALMTGLYLLVANDRNPAVPAVFAVSIGATAWYTSCSAALRGAGSVTPEAVNEVLSRLFVLVMGSALLVSGAGLLAAVATYAVADLASAAILTLAARRLLAADAAVDRSRLRWARMLPLGFATLAGVAYYRLDLWLLALLADAQQVARYSVCFRVLDVLILPAGALAMVAVGSTARLNSRHAVRMADRMAALLGVLALPAVVPLAVFPGTLLRVGFGPLYTPGADVLRLLTLAVLPSIGVLVWAPLVSLRGTGILAVTVASLMGNVVLNLLLIPRMGANGAALATVLGQTAYAVLLRVRLRSAANRSSASAAAGLDQAVSQSSPAR